MTVAPYVPVPDVLQMEVRYRLNGELVENVMYHDYSSVGFDTAVTDLGLNFVQTVWLQLINSFSPSMFLNEIYFTDLATEDGPTATYTTSLPDNGEGVLDSVPNGTALVLCWRTAKRGRSFRGRNYLTGFIETLCNNSLWTEAFVGDILGIYEEYRINALSDGEPMVVVSRIADGVPRTVGVATPVTAIANTNRGSRSQRRRNPGIGS